MAFPVTVSGQALDMGALPALKVCRYHGISRNGKVYTYARLYILDGALHFALTAFERTPEPESQVELAVAGAKDQMLLYRLSPSGGTLWRRQNGEETRLAEETPPLSHGNDEQGWSWSAESSFSPEALASIGLELSVGCTFQASVFKTRADEAAFGASFLPDETRDRLDPALFGWFEAVAY